MRARAAHHVAHCATSTEIVMQQEGGVACHEDAVALVRCHRLDDPDLAGRAAPVRAPQLLLQLLQQLELVGAEVDEVCRRDEGGCG